MTQDQKDGVVLLTAQRAREIARAGRDEQWCDGFVAPLDSIASGAAITKSAAAEREMQERIRQLTEWYDRQNGTPCEQIRHAQEVEALRAQVAALEKVLRLADELCTSVDCAAQDIGGQRKPATILAELGPAIDAAREGK